MVNPAALEVVRAVHELRAGAASAVGAAQRAAWLRGLRQVVDAAEVVFTEVLGVFDAHGDAQLLAAAPTTAAWCRRNLRIAHADASTRVRLARLAVDEPAMASVLESVASGALRYEQARQIERSVRCLDTPCPDEPDRAQRAAAVELLATLAVTEDVSTVAAAGRRIADVVNPDGVLRTRDKQLHRRHLQLSPLLDGMTAIDGVLDAEGAATVSAALAPLLVPAGPTDTRSTAQRRADALVDIAALALRTEELPQLSGHPVAVEVVISADALARSTQLRGSATSAVDTTQASPSCSHGPPDVKRTADWLASPWRGLVGPQNAGVVPGAPGGPAMVPVDVVARWLCDASVGRMLLGPGGVPLDLGRRQRMFTRDQRRALLIRDAGCRFTGCDRPPRYTDVHHVVPWASGGSTDMSNALLLCRFHHHVLHLAPTAGGWQLGIVDPDRGSHGPLTFTGPAGVILTSAPRGP